MALHSLGYIHLNVVDLEQWRNFAGNFLGMQEVEGPEADTLYFRMDAFHHRLAVTKADAPSMRAAGFQIKNAVDLEAFAQRLSAYGTEIHIGTREEADQRSVTGFISFKDPTGNQIELFYGPKYDHSIPALHEVSKFETGSQGMGHLIVKASDVEESLKFYRDILGFWERNTTIVPNMGTIYFMGCNERQHTLAIAPGEGPGLVHFMVEAATLDDVGRALDRARKHDIHMMQSIGKHTNDYMVSFYVWSPELIAVEFGFGGDRVGPDEATYEITEGAFWGHHFTPHPSMLPPQA